MVKIKRKMKSTDENNESNDDNNYDSKIENGTSEDDNVESSNNGFDNKVVKKKFAKNVKRKNQMVNEPLKKLKTDFKDKHLYKPTTVEELNQLRETENLFHSNLFRMQINEMLKELKVKEKYENFIKNWMEEFNIFLKSLESQKEKENFENLKWLKNSNIKLPICMEKFHSKNFNFQFLTPTENAIIIGSKSIQTIIGSELKCDVCITMPEKSFQKGDFLNLIYNHKRALYISYIAWQIKKQNFNCSEIKFHCFANNPYKPILEILPNGNYGKKIIFRIFVSPNLNDFKLNRFVPWNSNIRNGLFSKISGNNDEIILATPNYNSDVLFDLTMKNNHSLIETVIGGKKNLKDGLILLKIWLKQRHLNEGFSGFNNYILTMFTVELYKQRKLHSSMSSYQVARNIWNYLATSSWNENEKGLTMCSDFSESNMPTLEQMHSFYDVVFIDPSGFYNICANLSLDIYLRVKNEASKAIELLNNYNINSFQQLFMIKFPIYTQFDHIFGLTKSSLVENLFKKYGKTSDIHNFAGFWYPIVLKMITSVLRKGLDERIISLTPLETEIKSWNCNEKPKQLEKILKFGIILNPIKAYEILDKGPQANENKVQEFRDFWGDKCELRRFQDGSIAESCVWSLANETVAQKRLIVKKIIFHLMKHHFELNELTYIANEFDIVYNLNKNLIISNNLQNDAETTSIEVIKVFDDIGKKLRSLVDLPLDITGVLGISDVFRYCDPVPILNNAKVFNENGKYIFKSRKIFNGVIQLGVSGKWPNELGALRRLKTAFYIQIAQKLSTKYNLKVRGSIDGIHLIHNGYVYQLEIEHQKEIALLKKEINIKNIVQYNDTPESIELEKRLNILPKLTSVLHGLYQSYPCFGPTVMIAKRWLNSQLIDSYLWPDECTELIIASQFIKMNALSNPCQPQTGFLRFLHLMSTINWLTEFIFLNFNEEFSQKEITTLEHNFIAEREIYPSLFIATSYDQNKYGIWSKNAPNIHVLARVKMLAKHTLNNVEPCFQLEIPLIVKDLFVASLDGYDVLIKLKENIIPICSAYDFEITNNKNRDFKLPLAGLNPIEIGLQKLRDGYSDFGIFFYNKYGGKNIAVIWKPEIKQLKEFKLISVNGCQPNNDDKLICNVSILIEDFKIILKDLYASIELKT